MCMIDTTSKAAAWSPKSNKAMVKRHVKMLMGYALLGIAALGIFGRSYISIHIRSPRQLQHTDPSPSPPVPTAPVGLGGPKFLDHRAIPGMVQMHEPRDRTQLEMCSVALKRMTTVALGAKSLVVYHVGGTGDADRSLHQVYANNVFIYGSALGADSSNVFTIFNVLDGAENPYYTFLPWHLKSRNRMCVIDWNTDVIGDLTVAAIVAQKFGSVIDKFDTVSYLNQGVRGPMAHRAGFGWLHKFNGLIDVSSRVVMAGPSTFCEPVCSFTPSGELTCRPVPHLQTHMYTVAAGVVPMMAAYQLALSTSEMHNRYAYIEHVEVGLTQMVWSAGYHVANFNRADGTPPESADYIWDGTCEGSTDPHDREFKDAVAVQRSLFVKFGGEVMRKKVQPESAVNVITDATQMLINAGDVVGLPYWPENTPYSTPEA